MSKFVMSKKFALYFEILDGGMSENVAIFFFKVAELHLKTLILKAQQGLGIKLKFW